MFFFNSEVGGCIIVLGMYKSLLPSTPLMSMNNDV